MATKYDLSCGFVLYQDIPDRRFLLLKRWEDNEWDFPKGHPEKSEMFLDTAKRELMEETGLSPLRNMRPNGVIFSAKQFSYTYRATTGVRRKIILFTAKCDKNPTISKEHAGFAWFTHAEAIKALRFPEAVSCFKKICTHLKHLGKRM